MTYSRPTINQPFLMMRNNKITDASDSFVELIEFSKDDILGTGIGDVLTALRVSPDACRQVDLSGRTSCYLFTKTLEPREVIISKLRKQDECDEIYTFEEKPNSRLEEVLSYPCQLLSENMTGVSIYSAPDFILLKANQMYLDFADEQFRCPENTFGRGIDEFIPDYKGSPTETQINNIFVTGKSEIFREQQIDLFQRGRTYWDQVVTPVTIDGIIKYVVTNTQDVTERVLAKQQLVQQEKEKASSDEVIQYQAFLLQHISDIVISTDENYLIKSWNRAAELTYGWTEEEVVGKNVDLLFQTVVFDVSLEEEKLYLFEKAKIGADRFHTCKDGKKIIAHSEIQILKNERGQIHVSENYYR